jgi:hypothetical protein
MEEYCGMFLQATAMMKRRNEWVGGWLDGLLINRWNRT